ncbi:MAG TPA: sulfatase-like hydrolase/transferase [Polyangiaceae bacterium]|nr:sulfatase-like hydrolase/transferase [Polyangiaceae bacterium]
MTTSKNAPAAHEPEPQKDTEHDRATEPAPDATTPGAEPGAPDAPREPTRVSERTRAKRRNEDDEDDDLDEDEDDDEEDDDLDEDADDDEADADEDDSHEDDADEDGAARDDEAEHDRATRDDDAEHDRATRDDGDAAAPRAEGTRARRRVARRRAREDEDEEYEPRARPHETPWGHLVPPTLRFVAAVVLLDALVNVRLPLDEPAFWWAIPSTDIAIILLNLAIMGLLKGVVPRWMKWAVVVWLFLVRLVRFGDGIKGRYFAQRFNAYSDLGLVPDGIRFINSTRPAWEIVLGAVLALGALAGLAYLAYRALGVLEDYLRERRQVIVAAALLGITYVSVSAAGHGPKFDEYYAGGLAASAMPRLEEEVAFFWNVHGQQSEYATLIAQTETMLDGLPSDLAKLHGTNVYLILVESYGRTMFEWPPHVAASKATYDAFEKDLGARGFTMATGILNSTTYGGQSWLAHATLDTGVPVRGQLEYEIVAAKKPHSIAGYFHHAGYRTVLAQPNTTRAFSNGDFYGFDVSYLNRDFHYRGPDYAWATMPDQYVLDVMRRREIDGAKQPLFIQYVLVSSHAPWAKLPTPVDDWSRLGDGAIFNEVPMVRFPIEWPHFENATEAYGKSIIYDFDILRRYIGQFIDDGSLVIILGDHQPVAEVNGDTWEYGVPVHVLSKNAELVRPFLSRGYRRGMRPNLQGFAQGLETLLPNLLVDFSTERTVKP